MRFDRVPALRPARGLHGPRSGAAPGYHCARAVVRRHGRAAFWSSGSHRACMARTAAGGRSPAITPASCCTGRCSSRVSRVARNQPLLMTTCVSQVAASPMPCAAPPANRPLPAEIRSAIRSGWGTCQRTGGRGRAGARRNRPRGGAALLGLRPAAAPLRMPRTPAAGRAYCSLPTTAAVTTPRPDG